MIRPRSPFVPLLLAAVALLLSATGCEVIGHVSYLLNGFHPVPPKFDGLAGKRVAVVCLDDNSLSGPANDADAVARSVAVDLAYHVPDIEVVRQSEIADWMDNQNEDLTDYRDVGRGVKADMVVGIDLGSFSIHEGQTLLKGRASVAVKVFDMSRGGEVVYDSPSKLISWPENGARHVTEDEGKFRAIFLHTLAKKIARDFYSYELVEDYGLDAQDIAQ
jgi:hypothetical protein